MPTVSRQQQKLMHGIASGSIKPRRGLPPVSVAKEFATADHARGSTKLPDRKGSRPNSQAPSARGIANAINNGKPKESV